MPPPRADQAALRAFQSKVALLSAISAKALGA